MDSKLKNHEGPLLASLERRLFLRHGLSLGALSLLSGCALTDAPKVGRHQELHRHFADRAVLACPRSTNHRPACVLCRFSRVEVLRDPEPP